MRRILTLSLLLLTSGSAWQLLELAPTGFQQSGSATYDISTLDSRTASFNGSFYTVDALSSAFVQLSANSHYTLAQQLGEVLCFRVDATGFHSLELRNGAFELIHRYFNGSVASATRSTALSAVSGVCALHNGTLSFVELNTVHSGTGSFTVPHEVMDLTVIDEKLVALVYDTANTLLGLYHISAESLSPLSLPQLYDSFLGTELETAGYIGSVGSGPYPAFDLLEATATTSESLSANLSLQLSESRGTNAQDYSASTVETTTTVPALSITTARTTESQGAPDSVPLPVIFTQFVVFDYIGTGLQNLELSQGSITTYAFGTPTINLPGTLSIGAGSTLTIDVSGQDITDGDTLTLFTFSESYGSYENILIEGWTSTCQEIRAESEEFENRLQVSLIVTESPECGNTAGLLTNGLLIMLYFAV